MLQLHLLGPFRLLRDGSPVAGFEQARLQHLLAYLVLHRAAPVSRQQLAFAFWPETTDQQALKNLRTLLTRLRAGLRSAQAEADCLVEVTGQTIQWRGDDSVDVDVVAFERRLAQAGREPSDAADGLAAAVALYAGDLLPDCYEDWVLPLRDELRRACGDALERLTLLLEERREYGTALQAARRLLQHDPLDETAYHYLMRLHLALGDRTEALRAYRACAAMLSEEFGAQPGQAMQALYDRLRAAPDIPAPRASGEEPARDAPDLPLTGRGSEWERLLCAWRAAAGGRSRLLLVSGEAGIGKTRLVEELYRWAAGQGAAVAVAHCYPEGAGAAAAYAPVAEWLRSDALRPRLGGLPNVWRTEVARIAPWLTPEAEGTGGQRGPAPAGHWQRTRLFEALARTVLGQDGAAARQPLLLFLDDLHWCDQETLDWLGYLLRYAPAAPLLVAATIRKDEIDTRHPLMSFWLTLTRAGLLDEISLSPLGAAETAALAALAATRALSESEASRIYRQTEGNPLFVVETVRAGLSEEDAGPFAGDAEPVLAAMPPRVRAVIRWRLAQLSPPAQSLAQAAAAIGRRFSLDVLARVSGQDEALLLDGLDELWRRHLIRTEGAVEGGSAGALYDFSHDGIRMVAYDELGPIRRRAVHLRIARALEELGGEDRHSARQLAHHYEQAGHAQAAIALFRRAAQDSRLIEANAAAAGFYRHILEGELGAALSPAERCEVMLELVEIWAMLAEWPRMEALSREAVVLAGKLGAAPLAARAQAALAAARERLGYHDEALPPKPGA